MIVEPKVRGFICTTAHPAGCRKNVENQINYTKSKGTFDGPKNVLIIGASTGYGLASRISLTFGAHAKTIGVMFEREASGKRTATAGYYNTKFFEEFAANEGVYAKTINGDAFSAQIKEETIACIKQDIGKVDCVIYSLAAPRRTMADGTVYNSVLKTIDQPYEEKNLDLRTNEITRASLSPASEQEIEATVKVMGGEDWFDWMQALTDADALADQVTTIAYSYLGPELTYPIYNHGTIGKAKEHLYQTSVEINQKFAAKNVRAYISVNKALVTQASCAIPVVPLYIAVLYKVMKEMNLHEGCIQQTDRLFRDKMARETPKTDEMGRIRLDDLELRQDVQDKVMQVWQNITTETVQECLDLDGYWDEFYNMFGFRFEDVDYSADVEI